MNRSGDNYEMKETEMIEHAIIIDKNIQMRIKIPEIMDVISFTALLQKASKLIKMGDIQVPTTRKYTVSSDSSSDSSSGYISKWTKELKDELLKEYEGASIEKRKTILIKKYGFEKVASLQQKIYDIRKEKGISPRGKGYEKPKAKRGYVGGVKKYSDELVHKIEAMIKSGDDMDVITKKIKLNKKKIYDIVRTRIKKSLKELRGE